MVSKVLSLVESAVAVESIDALIAKRNTLRKEFFALNERIRRLDVEIDRLAHSDYGVELSHREREVLNLVLLERCNKEIASELRITMRTTAFHVTNLLEKFGLKGYSRQELIRKCRISY